MNKTAILNLERVESNETIFIFLNNNKLAEIEIIIPTNNLKEAEKQLNNLFELIRKSIIKIKS